MRDEGFISEEKHLESEELCVKLCDTYAEVGLGCTFSIWTPRDAANCVLYDEPFAQFLSHCDVLGGPNEISSSGCNVVNPEDHSCDGFRWFKLQFWLGQIGLSRKFARNSGIIRCSFFPALFRMKISLDVWTVPCHSHMAVCCKCVS